MLALNLMFEKISFDGKKFIFVPDNLVFLTNLIEFEAFPFLKEIKYSFSSLNIVKSNFSDRALTTDTPTPCRPPETL